MSEDLATSIPIDQITDLKSEATETIQAVVGEPFTIRLAALPCKDAPGPKWLYQYDSTVLQVTQAGTAADYSGEWATWVQFTPTQPGETQVLFVDRPRMINPLYVQRPYLVVIHPNS
jgi:hypothetical protein